MKKCSLRGLEGRADMQFYAYPKDSLPELSGYFLLTMDGPLLDETDKALGIFLIDGTWAYAEKMQKGLSTPHLFQKRSLPTHFQTAYPRRQKDCPDPARGLASVEALYLAYKILGRNSDRLLDNFYWKEEFLRKNRFLTF